MLSIYKILDINYNFKRITDFKINDKLYGFGKVSNMIVDVKQLDIDSMKHVFGDEIDLEKKRITMYRLNDIPYYITSYQPIMTSDGWKSLNPVKTLQLQPAFGMIRKLQLTDHIFKIATLDPLSYDTFELTNIKTGRINYEKNALYTIDSIGNYTFHLRTLILHNTFNCYNSQIQIIDSIDKLSGSEMIVLKQFFIDNYKVLQNLIGNGNLLRIAEHLGINTSI